jgi:hypothetical protein
VSALRLVSRLEFALAWRLASQSVLRLEYESKYSMESSLVSGSEYLLASGSE